MRAIRPEGAKRLRTHKPEAINWQYLVGIDETQPDAGESGTKKETNLSGLSPFSIFLYDLLTFLEDNAGIVTTETKCIVHGNINLFLLSFVKSKIHFIVNLRIFVFKIDCRRYYS